LGVLAALREKLLRLQRSEAADESGDPRHRKWIQVIRLVRNRKRSKIILWGVLGGVTLLMLASLGRGDFAAAQASDLTKAGRPSAATRSAAPDSAESTAESKVVVARVDGHPIYLSEVLRITGPLERNLMVRPGGTRWDDVKVTRLRELERRIAARLYGLAAVADPEVQPATAEVELQYQQELKRLGGRDGLQKLYGLEDEEVRSLLAIDIAAKRLREKHVINRIEVTPAQKEEYYERHRKDQFTIPPRVSVQAVFRFADSEEEWASEEQKIQAIRAELEEALNGVTSQREQMKILSGFVRAYSEHEPTRTSGGLWYIYGGHNIQKEFWAFEDAAFEAPEGELSPVVKVDRGYCVFLVGSKSPSRQQTYAEVEKQIDRILWKEQFETLQEQWSQSLREQYPVEIFEDALMSGVEREEPSAPAAGLLESER